MFERYTEKARRVIFFARYEASQYGSPFIETEHLLLGVVREEPNLMTRILDGVHVNSRIRQEIDKRVTPHDRIPPFGEVPLSLDCKKILNLAVEEAQDIGRRQIGPEFLLLGILRTERCVGAEVLRSLGVNLESARKCVESETLAVRTPTGRADARQALGSFLDALKTPQAEELSAFFSEDAQVVDLRGHTWIRPFEIDFASCFAPFATKGARFHVERAELGGLHIFTAIVLWENVTVGSQASRSMYRMSVVLNQESGGWKIIALQITPVVAR